MTKYANTLKNLKMISNGIILNRAQLESKGIDKNILDIFYKRRVELSKLKEEQFNLKAKLKNKTEELNEKYKEIHKDYSMTKKLIKIHISKTLWKMFGFLDKR